MKFIVENTVTTSCNRNVFALFATKALIFIKSYSGDCKVLCCYDHLKKYIFFMLFLTYNSNLLVPYISVFGIMAQFH